MTACVLVPSGCAGASTEAAAPVTSGPLTDGFDIEPGSSLLGAVFPLPYPYGGEGHQAILRVDDDVERAFEGYVQQAEDLGFLFDAEYNLPEGQRCNRQSSRDPAGPYPEACNASGSMGDDLGRPEARVGLQGWVESDGQGYIALSIGLYSDDAPDFSSVSDGPVAPATDDVLAPQLSPSTDDPPVRIVEGSRPMIEPLPSTCVTGGYVAVLEVTGELDQVLRGYEEQFGSARFTSDGLMELDDGLIVSSSQAGGGTMTAAGVEGDPSFVVVERCND